MHMELAQRCDTDNPGNVCMVTKVKLLILVESSWMDATNPRWSLQDSCDWYILYPSAVAIVEVNALFDESLDFRFQFEDMKQKINPWRHLHEEDQGILLKSFRRNVKKVMKAFLSIFSE